MPTRFTGSPRNLMHCMSSTLCRSASVRPGFSTSVSISPGRTAFTVIPSPPSSRAIARVMPMTAALEVT